MCGTQPSWFPLWVVCASGWDNSREEDLLRLRETSPHSHVPPPPPPLTRTKRPLRALALKTTSPRRTGPHPPLPNIVLRITEDPAVIDSRKRQPPLLRVTLVHRGLNSYKAPPNRHRPCRGSLLVAASEMRVRNPSKTSFLSSRH